MNKRSAAKLLSEISKTCPEVVEGGFYLKKSESSTSGNQVELRIISSQGKLINKNLEAITLKRSLVITEENGLLIIY